jgi:cellulose synthase/poly-beta-1,6-N-acetylglucosamine synthase-like glycosyltransferase
MNDLTKPFVSVIIPVYNNLERLKTCLEALEEQTYPRNLYEVIVVNNDPSQMKVIAALTPPGTKAF